MNKNKLFRELIKGEKILQAPIKTERFGEHVEVLFAINNDHTASLTMTREAFDILRR